MTKAAKVLEAETESREERRPETRGSSQTQHQPPYAVILHNDDVNGFEFVVGVLCKVFHYGSDRAFSLTMTAHVSGRSSVWSGCLEVAELKADQIRACGPDPEMKTRGAQALRVTIEPLPQ